MDLVHHKGSIEPVRSGGPWSPGACFVLWIQTRDYESLDPKQSQDRVFKFKLSHRSFACWQADLCEFGGNFCGGSAIERVHVHTSGMSLSSQANHSSDRLYKVYKRHGGVLLRFWPCLCLSFNIKFDHDPFDVFICCSTVILKNALMLKVALKIVTLIFWDCFHLDFKDHVSRRKYFFARNLSFDKCVIYNFPRPEHFWL